MLANENWAPPVVSVPQLPDAAKQVSASNDTSGATARSTLDLSKVSESGIVFAFGKLHCQQSMDAKTADTTLFQVANALLPLKFFLRDDFITSVACGDEHSAFISNTGRVFVIGKNSMGQLGLENAQITQTVTRPTCIKKLKEERVYRVGCGAQHTLLAAETKDGKRRVYSFGINSDLQLGIGRKAGEMCSTPQVVLDDQPETVLMLDGGRSHSAMVLSDFHLLVWGSGPEGQLGLGDQVIECDVPTLLNPPSDFHGFTAVACGYYHTLAVTSPPALFAFGEAEDGKLGVEPNQSDSSISLPKKVNLWSTDAAVTAISAGGNHSIAVTSNGHVYTMGLGSDGQLGVGTSIQASLQQPTLLKSFADSGVIVKSVSAGDSHSAFVTDDGKLFLCGNALHSRLGTDVSANAYAPRFANLVDESLGADASFSVTSAACGGCHTVCIANKISYAQAVTTKPFGDTTNNLSASSSIFTASSARLGRRKRKAEQLAAQSLNLPNAQGQLPQHLAHGPSKSLSHLPPLEGSMSLASTVPEAAPTVQTDNANSTMDQTVTSTTMAMAAALNSAPANLEGQSVSNEAKPQDPEVPTAQPQVPEVQPQVPEVPKTPPAESQPLTAQPPADAALAEGQPSVSPPPTVDTTAPVESAEPAQTDQTPKDPPEEVTKLNLPQKKKSGFSLPLICGKKQTTVVEEKKTDAEPATSTEAGEAQPEDKQTGGEQKEGEAEQPQEEGQDGKAKEGEKPATNSSTPTKTCIIL